MSDQMDNRYYKLAVATEFEALVQEELGDRSSVQPPDATLLGPIMQVIWTGASHREAAQGICSEETLVARHKELCKGTVLIDFLLRVYPELHVRLLEAQGRIPKE